MNKTYRRRPQVVEAVRWDGTNNEEIFSLVSTGGVGIDSEGRVLIPVKMRWPTPEKIIHMRGGTFYAALKGDWVVRLSTNIYEVLSNKVFNTLYEEVEDEDSV